MKEDKVFEYLKMICSKIEIVCEYENLYKEELKVLTTKVDSKLDFLIIFTLSIFNQTGTLGLLQSRIIRNKWMRGELHEEDGKIGENHPKNKGKLIQEISFWIKDVKVQKNMNNFVERISEWLSEQKKKSKEGKGFKSPKRCIESIYAFSDFLKKIDEDKLRSYQEFRDAMITFGFIRVLNSNTIEVTRKLPQMGEKTFGLFVEYLAFYTREKSGFEGWISEAKNFPIYGFSETYIKTFLREIYMFYANMLYDERLFKSFCVNSPISVDVIWNAYRRGETFSKFIKG